MANASIDGVIRKVRLKDSKIEGLKEEETEKRIHFDER